MNKQERKTITFCRGPVSFFDNLRHTSQVVEQKDNYETISRDSKNSEGWWKSHSADVETHPPILSWEPLTEKKDSSRFQKVPLT